MCNLTLSDRLFFKKILNMLVFSLLVSNKASLIKAGVIDVVLVLVDAEMLAVIFKMLGVLRMLVDGQGR